jgi:hypothetical protein
MGGILQSLEGVCLKKGGGFVHRVRATLFDLYKR